MDHVATNFVRKMVQKVVGDVANRLPPTLSDHFWLGFGPKVDGPTILGAGFWDSGHPLRKSDHSGGRFSMSLDQKWTAATSKWFRPSFWTSVLEVEHHFPAGSSTSGPKSSKTDLRNGRIFSKYDQNPTTRLPRWSGRPLWDPTYRKTVPEMVNHHHQRIPVGWR